MGSMHESNYQGAGAGSEQMKRAAAETTDELKAHGQERLEAGKDAAAAEAERVARAARRVADDLGEEDSTLAGYAAQLSQGVQRLADDLRTRSVSDIAQDLQNLARRNPTTFLLGSVAVGVALGRFMKASSGRTRQHPAYLAQTDGPEASQTQYTGGA